MCFFTTKHQSTQVISISYSYILYSVYFSGTPYCGEPGRVEHASKYGDVYTYGSSVVYDCNPGYELSSGKLVLNCTRNGTWSSQLPTCEYKRMYGCLKVIETDYDTVNSNILKQWQIKGHLSTSPEVLSDFYRTGSVDVFIPKNNAIINHVTRELQIIHY